MNTRLSAAFVLSLALGCVSALEPRFEPPVAPTENVVAERIASGEPRVERPVVVAIAEQPTRLIAYDLERRVTLWEQAVTPVSVPLIAGDAVVMQEAEGVVVRDLATGAKRVKLSEKGKLIHADGVGSNVVVTVDHGEGSPRGTVSLISEKSVRWTRALSQPVGSAAIVGEYVLVPWATQRLTVLNVADGTELVRWHFHNMTMGQARVVGAHAYVGQHGLLRVTKDIYQLRDGNVPLESPLKRDLPAKPPMLRDGYAVVSGSESAEHRVQLVWQPATSEGASRIEHDLLVLRFYRMVFGLSASADEVRWVELFERDLVAGQVAPSGLWLVDDAGNVHVLDQDGVRTETFSLGMRVTAAAIRAPHAAPATGSEGAAPSTRGDLHVQLLNAARDPDDRLVLARAYAVHKLAELPDASVTTELVDLCGAPRTPEAVRVAACTRLAAREQGAPEILAALGRRGSFLANTQAPPVGPLAQAALRMKLTQAAPLLLAHAESPNTQAADLPAVFQALEQLEYRAAVPALERFVRLHHGEPSTSELAPALAAAIEALAGLRAKTAKPMLEDVAQDELGAKFVREGAQKALLVIDTPPAPKVEAKAKVEAPKEELPAPPVQEVDARPYALDFEAVQKTLEPFKAKLEQCVTDAGDNVPSARVAMIVSGEGAIENLVVTPTPLQACMEPVLREARFPATRLGRQHVSHTVQRREVAQVPAEPAKAPKRARAPR